MSGERIGMTVSDLYARAVFQGGDRIAVTDGDRDFSYRDLGEGALRLSGALRGLGIGRGDRVAFLMVNCAEYVFCEYAVARIGATRVPLAVLLGAEDHVYMMNFARCRALVYHAQLTARVMAMLPELDTVELFVRVGEGDVPLPDGHLSLGALLEQAPDAQAAEAVDPEAIAGIYFTGGTTGRPKGVMLSHRAWVHTCYAEMLDFEVGWHEVFVFTTPMTHAAGCLLLPVLLRQGRCVLLERFTPEAFLGAVARERATASLVVPTIIYALLDFPERGRYDHSSLRNVLYGAAPMAPERMREALAAFGPVFTQFFGQTEAPMALAALPRAAHVVADPERELEVLASAGWPTFPTRMRLVDESGRDVAPGEPGEIVVQAPNMMSGYLDNPEATAEAIRDGWLHTGDIARRDALGLISIVDRKKDVIIRSGFNVYPREVEDVLFEHPAVRQAAVVGVPHEKWGEEVRAVVVLREGHAADERELVEFVKRRKGSIAAPTSIEFRDAIPLTNLGKVDKKAIRQAYWAGRERQV
jgi:fatty-acyl-CoA synthase